MTRHTLYQRCENDLLWYQRRDFLGAAAAWAAMGGFASAQAQQRSNIVELVGDAQLNGERLLPDHSIQSGDQIATGPDTTLIFVIGDASFKLRQNTRMMVERGSSLNAVSLLRLFTGAVASVWGRGASRAIVTPTLTAGIRGTGVYAEVFENNGSLRSYFCNCYGAVDLKAGPERRTSESVYHQAFWAESQPREGHFLRPAGAVNHGDEEIEMLARLLGQRTAWQLAGRKGIKDGMGTTENQPGQSHPARY